MKTRVTELLNIEYPVIQGGMAWVADANLAAHVSKAGGMGFIGAANAPAEWVKEQIHIARKITDKPVGVNIMLLSDYADEIAQLVIDEHIEAVTTGAGNPSKYMKAWKEAGIRVIPVVASVALARMMERAGADAVVAEGMESGGHIGEETTMTLVPQVVDAVNIPVIAAGGIGDGRGVCAAFMLGAEAVQMGTLDMSIASTPSLSGFTDCMNYFDLPYLFKATDSAWSVMDEWLGQDRCEALEGSGFKGLGFYDNGEYMIGSNKKLVHPEDAKGLRIRAHSSQLQCDSLSSIGANPLSVAWGDIYTSLQQGTIDGVSGTTLTDRKSTR